VRILYDAGCGLLHYWIKDGELKEEFTGRAQVLELMARRQELAGSVCLIRE